MRLPGRTSRMRLRALLCGIDSAGGLDMTPPQKSHAALIAGLVTLHCRLVVRLVQGSRCKEMCCRYVDSWAEIRGPWAGAGAMAANRQPIN